MKNWGWEQIIAFVILTVGFFAIIALCAAAAFAQERFTVPVNNQDTFWFTACPDYKNACADSAGYATLEQASMYKDHMIFFDLAGIDSIPAYTPFFITVYGEGLTPDLFIGAAQYENICGFACQFIPGQMPMLWAPPYNDSAQEKEVWFPFTVKHLVVMRQNTYGYSGGGNKGVHIDKSPAMLIKKVSITIPQHSAAQARRKYFPHIGNVIARNGLKYITR